MSDLAAIVAKDADWDAVFTGADWRAADVLADRRALLGLLREAREALREAVETVHHTGSIRDHVDESDKTGWNVRGIETCRSPECVEDLDLLARLSALTEPEP